MVKRGVRECTVKGHGILEDGEGEIVLCAVQQGCIGFSRGVD